MKLIWYSYLVLSLDNYIYKTFTETGLTVELLCLVGQWPVCLLCAWFIEKTGGTSARVTVKIIWMLALCQILVARK